MYTMPTNVIAETVDVIDFQIPDEKGRSIGAKIFKHECDFVEQPADANCGYEIPAGHYYRMSVHATRNGKSYGACQPTHNYKTDEERTQALEKYLKDAKKRAMKKTNKGV